MANVIYNDMFFVRLRFDEIEKKNEKFSNKMLDIFLTRYKWPTKKTGRRINSIRFSTYNP